MKKKHISFNQKEVFNSHVTTKLLENVNHDKLNLLVDNLRKISNESPQSPIQRKEEYLNSPLSIEINELKQRREIGKKKPQTSVWSPQEINKTKRAEVFFQDAIARRTNKDIPKMKRY